MGMRPGFVVATALALGVAAILVLLANGVFALDHDLRSWEQRLAHAAAGAGEPAGSSFRTRVAETLLAAGDDRSFLEALQLFRSSRASGEPSRDLLAQHGEAEVALTRIVREEGNRRRRAEASNLLGILGFEDAQLDRRFEQRHLDLALDAFENAVRLDPENEDAKYNLELLLTIVTTRKDPRGSGESQQGAGGADLRPPGSGY